jgi:uncharacterized membrane protein YkvA (DUF1232 family)
MTPGRWLRERAWALKRETVALYLAARDPRTPWYAKALALAIVAYAASPIDLIPDFIPVLGYLDELILLPLGILLVLKLVPAAVLAEARARAAQSTAPSDGGHAAAAAIVAIWLLAALLCGIWLADLVA